ncbi:helix-turn-helix domain-containing protein [Nocardia sp. NPDC005366]|uniref:MmyB family transcriptional regulator n=1 Tax=Nocardia sp. NPDC005366 TaxID=3156878 RepID=UPI0033BA0AD7
MGQKPRSRSSTIRAQQLDAHMPTLATTCRQIREQLGLSRTRAYDRHHVSNSYLAEIETGGSIPSFDILEQMIEGYRVGPLMARHILELRTAAVGIEPTAMLRRTVTTDPTLRFHLQDLERRGVHAALIDPMWNVLVSNESFRAVTPGLEDIVSIPEWMFSAHARELFLHWPSQAAHAAASIRALLGRYRDSEQARILLRNLSRNEDFMTYWTSGITVAYGRDISDLMHANDPITGEPASFSLTISNATQAETVHLITLIRRPLSGPPPSTSAPEENADTPVHDADVDAADIAARQPISSMESGTKSAPIPVDSSDHQPLPALTHEPTYPVIVGAQALGKSRRWYMQQLRTGRLPGHKAGRSWFLTAADIAAALNVTGRAAVAAPGRAAGTSVTSERTYRGSGRPRDRRRPIPPQSSRGPSAR